MAGGSAVESECRVQGASDGGARLDVEIGMSPRPNQLHSQMGGMMLCDVGMWDSGGPAGVEGMLLLFRRRKHGYGSLELS